MDRRHIRSWLVPGAFLVAATLAPAVAAGAAPVTVAGVKALAGIAAGPKSGGPSDISCPTVRWCVAVGGLYEGTDRTPGGFDSEEASEPVAWVLSAGRWTHQVLPLPAGGPGIPDVLLGSVSCPQVGRCVAIGSYYTSARTSNIRLLSETLRSGTWTETTIDLPAGSYPSDFAQPDLSPPGLSCVAVTDCVAVSSVGVPTKRALRTVPAIYRLRGTRWTSRTLPTPPGRGGPVRVAELDAVSCPTSSDCVAAGWYFAPNNRSVPLVESFDGSRWKATVGVGPAAAKGAERFQGISCPSVRTCTAVGSVAFNPSSGRQSALIEMWRRGHWTSIALSSSVSSSSLASIACPSTVSCVAAGWTGTYGFKPLVETLHDGGWSPTAPPGRGILHNISCPRTGSCVATVGLSPPWDRVETLARGHWSGRSVGLPTGEPVAALVGVSCSAPSRCVAVGEYGASDGAHDLIETSGPTGGWTPTVGIDIAGSSPGLDAISCAPASARSSGCVAVGAQAVEVLSGGHWRGHLLHLAPGERDASLEAVSCATSRSCVAVGDVVLTGPDQVVPLIVTRRGSRWTLEALRQPAESQPVGLDAVSCPTPTTCVAVGSGNQAERLSHGAWINSTLGPSRNRTVLTGVDCPLSTGSCTAIGTDDNAVVVARLRGVTWRRTTVHTPGYPSLGAISCPTQTRCEATLNGGFQPHGLSMLRVFTSSTRLGPLVTAPPKSVNDGLWGISCPLPSACVIVGAEAARTGGFALVGTSGL